MTLRSLLFFGVAACAAVGAAVVAYVTTVRPLATPLDPERVDLSALDQVPAEVWAQLRTRRIYFGHQSVGGNVIAGMEWILSRRPDIGLRIVAADSPDAFSAPGLYHGPIGVNGEVKSKLEDFGTVVRGPRGAQLDIAFMKFCYVDMVATSDPRSTLAAYRSTIDTISKDRPGLQVIHTTMPLTALEIGRKAYIKRLVGLASDGESANVARESYNEILRTAYERNEIFDLAAIEASAPGQLPQTLDKGGRGWPTLAPELTTDGGHLNPGGGVLVARELLLLLARHAGKSSQLPATATAASGVGG